MVAYDTLGDGAFGLGMPSTYVDCDRPWTVLKDTVSSQIHCSVDLFLVWFSPPRPTSHGYSEASGKLFGAVLVGGAGGPLLGAVHSGQLIVL